MNPQLRGVKSNYVFIRVGGDLSPPLNKQYEKKWEAALKILATVKESNRDGKFYRKLKDHLENSAKYAIDDLAKKIKAGDRLDYHQPLIIIINEYYDKLLSV